MNVYSLILSPISLTFLVIAAGLCLGKLKLFHISLDLAAVLIVAVFVGYVIDVNSVNIGVEQLLKISTYLEMFSSFGTALFVSVVGLTTGYSLHLKSKVQMTSGIIGTLMAASALMVMWIVLQLDDSISKSNLLGILCGALTTTPGLSSVCEKD